MDQATANLPSRSLSATADFYASLGFSREYADDGWMILRRGDLLIEFFRHDDLDPATSSFSCCLRLDDIDAFYEVCLAAGVPEATHGFPRLHLPRVEDSGLRIGALLDPDGTLLRLIANPQINGS